MIQFFGPPFVLIPDVYLSSCGWYSECNQLPCELILVIISAAKSSDI